MDTKPVTRGNDVLMSKPCHQTSPVPYSTENRSNINWVTDSLNTLEAKFATYPGLAGCQWD